MNKRRNLQILFLGFLLVSICMVLWNPPKEAGPAYRGKTAQEWFDSFAIHEVGDNDFNQALSELGTNFFPTLKNLSGINPKFAHLYDVLPLSLQRMYRRLPSKNEVYAVAHQAALKLGQSTFGEDLRAYLKEELRNCSRFDKNSYLGLIGAAYTGSQDFSDRNLLNYLTHQEFAIRYYAAKIHALYYGNSLTNLLAEKVPCVPVFVEALTNGTLMKHTFGVGDIQYAREAATLLKTISPETAAKYSEYIRQ